MTVKLYNKTWRQSNFKDLTGGVDTRHSPLVVEADSKKKLVASALNNVDFFKDGSVQKRLGKTKVGDDLTSANLLASQTSANTTSAQILDASGVTGWALAQKFVPGSSVSVNQITFDAAIAYTSFIGQTTTWEARVYSDSSGSPGTNLGSSTAVSVSVQNSAAYTTNATDFAFAVPVAVTSGTTYWIVLVATNVWGAGNALQLIADTQSGATVNIKGAGNISSPSWVAKTAGDLYYKVYYQLSGSAITGIYDYRHGYAQTREQLVTVNGNLYKRNKSGGSFISTWTSLANTLPNGQDYLSSFATFKDYAFVATAAQAPAVLWDGASTGAMRHGYRLSPPYVANYTSITIDSIAGTTITLAANQTASGLYVGKTVWLAGGTLSPQAVTIKSYVTAANPGTGTGSYYVTSITVEEQSIQTDHTSVRWNGCTLATGTGGSSAITSGTTVTTVSVLAVTALKSGGYRASEFSLDIPTAGGPYKLAFSNLAMNATTNGTEFAFDIPERATTFFISPLFDPGATTSARSGSTPTITYYKLPASSTNLQGGLNPVVNSTTAIDIYTVATTTWETLLDVYGLPPQYFSAQRDAPKSAYLTLFQGFLLAAGSTSNPNRLFASQVDAPNVWSAAGESYGSFYDLDPNDGDVIKGLASYNTSLYVFKQHGIYYGEYTGLASAPFAFRRLQTSLGALSGFSVKQLDWGVVFLSERGPAYVSGTQVGLLPGADAIQNLFDPNDSDRYNLSVMAYSTAGHNATKQQVWWGVASTNSTNRDQVLVYDYGNRAFWTNTDSSNYFSEVGDASGFFSVWSGNYNGQVFQQESGATDNGTNIPFLYQSAWLTFSDGSDQKQIDRIWVRGDVQSSAATLSVDIYRDFGTTAARSVTFDMTAAQFKAGMQVPLNLQGKAFSVALSCTNAVPLKIDSFQLDWQDRGDRS